MRKTTTQKRLRAWWARVGVFCFVAGVVTPLVGGVLTVIEWIVGAALHPRLHVTATALFIVGIPLILFAGFCLDWGEQGRKKPARHPEGSQRGAETPAHVLSVALPTSSRFTRSGQHSTDPAPTFSVEVLPSRNCQSPPSAS